MAFRLIIATSIMTHFYFDFSGTKQKVGLLPTTYNNYYRRICTTTISVLVDIRFNFVAFLTAIQAREKLASLKLL